MNNFIKPIKNLAINLKRKFFDYNNHEIYNKDCYLADQSFLSAKNVIQIFSEYYKPGSVIDIGCGVGTWLKAWQDAGTNIIKGLDCNNVADEFLYFDREYIEKVDLEKHKNVDNIFFDLAMSLEVAEHLPQKASADFVDLITSYSDIIIFSAAIPHQPGTRHINCHPLQFWVDLFNKKDYQCFDFLRPKLIKNDQVDFWYKQNILVFVKSEKTDYFVKQGLNIDNQPHFYYYPEIVEYLANK